eukprot:TRINITY_DN73059_c0_g1_i1.p1 TRINITY_DN73059_c0_g1~~TRINITY_DN73059_c0_g1_i1.p1  ORF type:complete len:528 (-),score=119.47 TRINITY_DN73059_c0_g1_i1:46-1572(-)
MAFKPESDDCCESLAFKLQRLLQREGAEVVCSDAYMPLEASHGFVSPEKLLESSEAIFIGCPHAKYQSLVFEERHLVFDCWGFARKPKLNIVSAEDALSKDSRRLTLAVVGGAGHVGLPLSLVLAQHGHRVKIVDNDLKKLESIKAGSFPFLEAGGPELLKRCLAEFPERVEFTGDVSAVRECDVIIVTIGTPVDEHLNPCFSVIEDCIKALKPFLHGGQTLVLRSTLFPGTSSRVLAMLRAAGLEAGISFCPERIAQGKALEELTQLPQVISGSDARALAHAKVLFAPLGMDLVELDLQEAETAKLFLNSWRYVAFGTANQFYHIATSRGLNFERLRAAIVHRYPRAANFPRAGFTAGPCLFKDTMQLAAYCRHTFSLGHAAMLVNETMPECVVEQAKKDLSLNRRSLLGVRCGVLGMAFKPDNDDKRESLAYKLRRLLVWEGAQVCSTDVYLQRDDVVTLEQLLSESELVFVGCPHSQYREVTFRQDQKVYDCWGFFEKSPMTVSA